MTMTIADKIADLSHEQQVMLKQLHMAKLNKDNALVTFQKVVRSCHEAGISFGMMGHELNERKETLWRQVERNKLRTNPGQRASR